MDPCPNAPVPDDSKLALHKAVSFSEPAWTMWQNLQVFREKHEILFVPRWMWRRYRTFQPKLNKLSLHAINERASSFKLLGQPEGLRILNKHLEHFPEIVGRLREMVV